MNPELDNPGAGSQVRSRKRAPFQPFVVGLFCLLLVSLFLVTALMDVRRTQDALMDVFENTAVGLIESVEIMAQEKLKMLSGFGSRATQPVNDLQDIEEGFRLQEAVLIRLIEVGREADRIGSEEEGLRRGLGALAREAEIRAIHFLDETGRTLDTEAALSPGLVSRARSLLAGSDEILIDSLTDSNGKESFQLILLRRKNAKGIVALVVDESGLRFWASRVAVQEAVEKSGWRKGVRYFIVSDGRGRLLARAGDSNLRSGDGGDHALLQERGAEPSRVVRRLVEGPLELLEVSAPIRLQGRWAGTASVGMEITEVRNLREKNQAHIFYTTGFMTLAGLFAILLFYQIQTRHLRRLQEMQERLNEAERLSSLGRLAAGLAHEVRNPLNAVSMAVQRIQREFKPTDPAGRQEFSSLVSVVRREIGRLDGMIEDFLAPSRVKPDGFKAESVTALLERVVRLLREEASTRDIQIECDWEDRSPVVNMDPGAIHQALFNILKNAMEAISGPGSVMIRVREEHRGRVLIFIRDSGDGLSEEALKQIYNFGYTTKEKGLGLGLPIAREIIRAHGGSMEIESEPGKGTAVKVLLPRRLHGGGTQD